MSKLSFDSFEELESKLSNWLNFSSTVDEEESSYDFIGIMLLLKACIQNISKYSVDSDFEELEDFFTKEEIEVLRTIINSQPF